LIWLKASVTLGWHKVCGFNLSTTSRKKITMQLSLKAYMKIDQTLVRVTMRHLIGLILLVVSTLANAGPITYDVNRKVGGGSVFGTITTDGTVGSLANSNILDWSLLLDTGFSNILLTEANSGVSINPNQPDAVFAATEALWFDFSVLPSLPFPFLYPALLFQYEYIGSGKSAWCLSRDEQCGGFTYPLGWETILIGAPGGYDKVITGHVLEPEIFATAAPISSTAWLLGLGLAGLGWLRRRRLFSR
jgi:hypothetical protein